MEYTGERFMPGVHGSIELEHMHRYLQAAEIASNMVVLDIACGEGYGSDIIARSAQKVIGVDISFEAVSHARQKYSRPNLEFMVGSCSDIPLPTASIDLVVSFETLEHHDQHEQMMVEIKRVLKPTGILIISSPDKYNYSVEPGFKNDHHIKELYAHEFKDLIARHYQRVSYFGQRILYGSGVFPESGLTPIKNYMFENGQAKNSNSDFAPIYWIAIASDAVLPQLSSGVLDQPISESEITHFWRDIMSQKDAHIAELNMQIIERSKAVSMQYEENLMQKDLSIKDLSSQIKQIEEFNNDFLLQKESLISELNSQIEELARRTSEALQREQSLVLELNIQLGQKSDQVAELVSHLQKASEAHLESITQFELEKESDLARIQQLDENFKSESLRIVKLIDEIEELKHQVSSITASNSWKITAPLRQVSMRLRNIKSALIQKILGGYRSLPINQYKRQKIKSLVFSVFGPLFGKWPPYIEWKNSRAVSLSWEAPISVVEEVSDKKIEYVSSVPVANGRFEWEDYLSVKSKIEQIKAAQITGVSISPINIIKIGNESLEEVARKIALPKCSESPVVSIILPVFNNIKFTLECLLSITKYPCPTVSYEVIIADDASTDGTDRILRSIPNIKLVRNDTNLGFLLNCNRALDSVTGKYVLYLNNDVQVTDGWLSALVNTFNTYPKVGAVGPRFIYPSGHLQEAGVTLHPDGTAEMIGLNQAANQDRFSYVRRVDYISGACLLIPTEVVKKIGGFSEEFLPCYCEDSDLCLSIQNAGYFVYYNPNATIVHHLSKTTGATDVDFKMRCIYKNQNTLQNKWGDRIAKSFDPKLIAFYLPQYHPIPENNKWWGTGFTEWTNVSKAKPNFLGHYQPRIPADLGYYDLRLTEVMEQQAQLAERYGVHGFCFYYYWFNGRRLLEKPIEQMLESQKPDFPFCLCWANENWTRRWDGQDQEVLMAQAHSESDDEAVILDLIRYFVDARYIRVDGRPLILVYRVTLFPDFFETSERWRKICREKGIGEIYIAMVESFELVHSNTHPKTFGCDAALEFPPQGLAQQKAPSGKVINPDFAGSVADYRDLAVSYAMRNAPAYTRFKGVTPGWDNTARRVNTSFAFEHASPGAFQAWLEEVIAQTRSQQYGDERLVFINAWNEWAEGAYLEPDRRFGHTYLEAVKNALDAFRFLNKN